MGGDGGMGYKGMEFVEGEAAMESMGAFLVDVVEGKVTREEGREGRREGGGEGGGREGKRGNFSSPPLGVYHPLVYFI